MEATAGLATLARVLPTAEPMAAAAMAAGEVATNA